MNAGKHNKSGKRQRRRVKLKSTALNQENLSKVKSELNTPAGTEEHIEAEETSALEVQAETKEEQEIQAEIKKQEEIIATLETDISTSEGDLKKQDKYFFNDDDNADSDDDNEATRHAKEVLYRNGRLKLEQKLNRAAYIEKKEQPTPSPKAEKASEEPKNDVNPSYFQQFYQWLVSSIEALLQRVNQFFTWIGSMVFPAAQPAPTKEPAPAEKTAPTKQNAPTTPFFDEKKAAQRYFGSTTPNKLKPDVSNKATPATIGLFSASAESKASNATASDALEVASSTTTLTTPGLVATAESKNQDPVSANEALAIENNGDAASSMNFGS